MKVNKKKPKLILGSEHQKGEVQLDLSQLKQSITILQALNHKVRQEILKLVSLKKAITVSDIYLKLNLRQSFVSQQLALLRSAKVLVTSRKGKFTYYMLNMKKLKTVTIYMPKLLD